MSKEEFVEMMTSFVFDVQQSVGFDTDASRTLLAMLDVALAPLRSRCQTTHDAVAHLERHIGRILVRRYGDIRTRFLRFDRQTSGYMSYSDFRSALDVLNLDVDPSVLARLFQKYDPQGQGRINYTNFLHLVHATDSEPPRSEAHDALASLALCGPPVDTDDLALLEHRRTEELVAHIRAKLYQRGMSVRDLFLQMDQGRYSFLTLGELHHGFKSIIGVDMHMKELMYLTRHFTRKQDQLSLVDFGKLLEGFSSWHGSTVSRTQRDGANAIKTAAAQISTARISQSSLAVAKLASVLQDKGMPLRRLFDLMAPRGSLAPLAFHKHLCRWGLDIPDEADVVRLVAYFDTNGNGALEFNEFVRLCQRLCR